MNRAESRWAWRAISTTWPTRSSGSARSWRRYFEATQDGHAPNREEWLARYPELTRQLAAFLDEQDRLLQVTEPLRSIVKGIAGGPGTESIAGYALSLRTKTATDGDTAGSAVHVFGDYELLGETARGGMGVVYRPRQRSLNRPVALKMLRGSGRWPTTTTAAVPPRGRGRRQPRPPEHRADLRGGRARRPPATSA